MFESVWRASRHWKKVCTAFQTNSKLEKSSRTHEPKLGSWLSTSICLSSRLLDYYGCYHKYQYRSMFLDAFPKLSPQVSVCPVYINPKLKLEYIIYNFLPTTSILQPLGFLARKVWVYILCSESPITGMNALKLICQVSHQLAPHTARLHYHLCRITTAVLSVSLHVNGLVEWQVWFAYLHQCIPTVSVVQYDI